MSNEQDYESFDEEELGLDDLPDQQLFYSITIKANEKTELEPPSMPGYNIRITNATFGDDVNNNSKTIITCQTETDKQFTPLCKLIEKYSETIKLDLIFAGMFILALLFLFFLFIKKFIICTLI